MLFTQVLHQFPCAVSNLNFCLSKCVKKTLNDFGVFTIVNGKPILVNFLLTDIQVFPIAFQFGFLFLFFIFEIPPFVCDFLLFIQVIILYLLCSILQGFDSL